MRKIAIAILLSAGALFSVQAQAADRAVIGAVDGALVGSYFGGAHGAVAGAILGAVVGSSVDDGYYDGRGRVRYERDYGRYESQRGYYDAAPVAYETYYEPQPVVYVQPYRSYPVVYASYGAPYYGGRYGYGYGYASPRYVSYNSPRNHYNNHGRRY